MSKGIGYKGLPPEGVKLFVEKSGNKVAGMRRNANRKKKGKA